MFQSATFKLTAGYLAIIVVVSLLFSVVIYSIASREVDSHIGYLQSETLPMTVRLETVREAEVHKAQANLQNALAITNLTIWILGGVGSYYLARHTLRPIEQAHEAQSRFTSDASHELRTPLASMKTEIEVALRDPHISKANMRELLASNLEEVNTLARLSQTLLQLSQLDHQSISHEKLDLVAIARTSAARLDGSGKRIRIEDKKPHHVTANRASVEELFAILLDNALKYSPHDSTVTIAFHKAKHMTGFHIQSGGPGISHGALPHIFNRFFRADTSRTSDSKKGYGLGLSLAKKIVEHHRGTLSATSVPGATTFTVLLPTVSARPAERAQ